MPENAQESERRARCKMKQAIVILLGKSKEIELIRKKYDPFYKKIENHISLVFPFENVNQKVLSEHINKSISGIKPFKLALRGIKKSQKDFYLYLLADKGKKTILKLHKHFYSSFLAKWLKKDIPYIPHLTLGIFKTKTQIDNAVKELKNKKIRFDAKIDSIYLLTLKKDLSIKSLKRFRLS